MSLWEICFAGSLLFVSASSFAQARLERHKAMLRAFVHVMLHSRKDSLNVSQIPRFEQLAILFELLATEAFGGTVTGSNATGRFITEERIKRLRKAHLSNHNFHRECAHTDIETINEFLQFRAVPVQEHSRCICNQNDCNLAGDCAT